MKSLDLEDELVQAIHEWIRDCGLDVRDVEAFVKRELAPLITIKTIEARLDELKRIDEGNLELHRKAEDIYIAEGTYRVHDFIEYRIQELQTKLEGGSDD